MMQNHTRGNKDSMELFWREHIWCRTILEVITDSAKSCWREHKWCGSMLEGTLMVQKHVEGNRDSVEAFWRGQRPISSVSEARTMWNITVTSTSHLLPSVL
jgi:hypothetical protein